MKNFENQFNQLASWQPPEKWLKIRTIDAHTCGEPLRVIVEGLPEIKGSTMLEKRRYMKTNLDWIRKTTMWEPRGHADMYGCIITPPVSPEADFGVLFLHNEGYSTMCGHGIIAITKVALTCGLMEISEPETSIKIDSPAGLITSFAKVNSGTVENIRFINVPSFVLSLNNQIYVDGIGTINYDVAFGGAFYAFVSAKQCNVELNAASYRSLIEKGMAIKKAVMASHPIDHPYEKDLEFLYGVIFIDDSPRADSCNVCVFAEGEVDRSPTGTGVSARMAIHYAKGDLKVGEAMTIESITGSSFTCSIKALTKFGKYDAVVPVVEGNAFISSQNTFIIDPNDPFREGFFLR